MDLDDSFTEKLLQRNRARKEFLHEKCAEAVFTNRKRAALVEEQQMVSDPRDEPLEDSPKRHCAEGSQASYENKENVNTFKDDVPSGAFVPFHSAAKTKGLAALKRNFVNGDVSDDYQSTAKHEQGTPNDVKFVTTSTGASVSEERKDSCPADDEFSDDESINEDDFAENYMEYSSKNLMDYSPVKSYKNQETIKLHSDLNTGEKCTSVQSTVSGPAFPPIPVQISTSVQPQNMPLQGVQSTNIDPAELPLSARKALFEKALIGGTPKVNEMPSNHQLSVAQRAALFESAAKSTNTYKTPAAFKEPKRIKIPNFTNLGNNNSPVKNLTQSPVKAAHPVIAKSPIKTSQPVAAWSPVKAAQPVAAWGPVTAAQPLSTYSPVKAAQPMPTYSPVKAAHPMIPQSPVKAIQTVKTDLAEVKGSPVKNVALIAQSIASPTKNIGTHTRLMQQKLMEGSDSILVGKENAAKAADERKQELSSLVNRWEKLSSSSVENNSEIERHPVASDEFACSESDAFQQHSEYEDEEEKPQIEEDECSDDLDTQSVFESDQAEIGSVHSLESASSYEPSLWAKEDDTESTSSQPPRSTMSSVSYSGVSSYSDDSHYNTTRSHSCTSDSSAGSYDVTRSNNAEGTPSGSREDQNPNTPLMHTVSFYRKQKQEAKLTPVRTIVRRENILSPEFVDIDYTEMIQEKIKALQEDVLKQQTVISQASQALNLCNATTEFTGSTEQVEGERLLLIATQKRQALLNEIQRLKTYSSQGEMLDDGKGKLIISDIQLPLKREFMASQLDGRGNDSVHYFLCLIRHGAQVMVTQMMSTDDKVSDGALCFTNHIKLQNLPADFSVVFEVYGLEMKKEVVSHDKKYHIRRDHSKIRLAPKGKRSDSKHTIPVSSPGGPNAVRSSSFGVVGFTRFTIHNCHKKSFTLDKVPFTSPVEGILKVRLQLHAEHKVKERGFLTMFEEIGGFGAWHRRWCLLDSNHLAYWKYPDEENKKEPIGIVDLKQCITAEVKTVSRDVCARPHTFEISTVRPQAKGDKETLVAKMCNTLTTTKFLLSADTKEERLHWCNKLNEALSNVRKWDPQALRPVEALRI